MSIPVSFKLIKENREKYLQWVVDAGLTSKITYDWARSILTFEDRDDATAFSLTFGISRFNTAIDEKLKNEESNN